jgi:hypothetical protein
MNWEAYTLPSGQCKFTDINLIQLLWVIKDVTNG